MKNYKQIVQIKNHMGFSKVTRNKVYGCRQSQFHPVNKEKYNGTLPIITRSSWEHSFCMFCDKTPNIIKWASESIVIPYFDKSSNKERRYFIDFSFTVKTKNNEYKTYWVEIKPHKQTLKPEEKSFRKKEKFIDACNVYIRNVCKWKAATEAANKRGYEFKVITEKELHPQNYK